MQQANTQRFPKHSFPPLRRSRKSDEKLKATEDQTGLSFALRSNKPRRTLETAQKAVKHFVPMTRSTSEHVSTSVEPSAFE